MDCSDSSAYCRRLFTAWKPSTSNPTRRRGCRRGAGSFAGFKKDPIVVSDGKHDHRYKQGNSPDTYAIEDSFKVLHFLNKSRALSSKERTVEIPRTSGVSIALSVLVVLLEGCSFSGAL